MSMQLLEQYILEADVAFSEQDYVRGKAILEDALAIEPDYGEAHNYLGWLYLYHINDYEKAEQHLRLAIRFKPNCKGAYVHLSTLLTDQRRFQEMQQLMEKAFRVKGINRQALFSDLGRLYEQMEDYEEAVRYYKEAMKASLHNGDMDQLRDHIRRCRRKRWIAWI